MTAVMVMKRNITKTEKLIKHTIAGGKMLEAKICDKCEQKATITVNDRYYCSIHGLEESARIEPELLIKIERHRILGITKK